MSTVFRTWHNSDGWELLDHFNGLKRNAVLVIPTNVNINSDGYAIMGAGLALAAAQRYPELPDLYGRSLQDGQRVFHHKDILCIPTKLDWRFRATLDLIRAGFQSVADHKDLEGISDLLVPKMGAGLGKLPWEPTKEAIKTILADYSHVVCFLE